MWKWPKVSCRHLQTRNWNQSQVGIANARREFQVGERHGNPPVITVPPCVLIVLDIVIPDSKSLFIQPQTSARQSKMRLDMLNTILKFLCHTLASTLCNLGGLTISESASAGVQ